MQIVRYPDPSLNQPSKDVLVIDFGIRQIVDGMSKFLHEKDGLGLSAVQVGHPLRVFVLDLSTFKDSPSVFINPEIIEKRGHDWSIEGCLSIPGVTGRVRRYREIDIVYNDLDGSEHEMTAEGLLSVAIQHEMDHLEGMLFTSRLGPVESLGAKRKMKVLERVFRSRKARERKALEKYLADGCPDL